MNQKRTHTAARRADHRPVHWVMNCHTWEAALGMSSFKREKYLQEGMPAFLVRLSTEGHVSLMGARSERRYGYDQRLCVMAKGMV